MDALIRSVNELFANTARYVVPAYQRPYVWNEDDQWMPLWEDVERVADARLEGDSTVHFLGAVVIRVEKTPPGGVTEWSVIDGQQRLTTLQILISAMAAGAEADGLERDARRLRRLTMLDEDDADGDERFKFWPTNVNRNAFREAMDPGADGDGDDPHNTVHEAWEFFRGRVGDYVRAEGADADEIVERYRALVESVTGLLSLVTIALDRDDPAQVIFETLNARGTPLLAMDLVKNALFEGAEREGIKADEAFERYWRAEFGDHAYWGADYRLGRSVLPRSEAFLFHWLAMRLGEVIPTDRLFDLFRRRLLSDASSVAILQELSRDAHTWRRFGSLPPSDPAFDFFQAMAGLDLSTMHPVALLLHRPDVEDERRARALRAIESYTVRRLLRGLSGKDYTYLAARLIARGREALDRADDAMVLELLSSQADSARWPDDDEMRMHLTSHPLYGWLGQRRLAFVLAGLERAMRTDKTELLDELPGGLEIEHVMPRAWRTSWPLDDPDDEAAAEERERRLNLLGNLTLATKQLNVAMSNWPWDRKREELNRSLLVLNRALWNEPVWDEAAIDRRGTELTELVLRRWPGPQHFMPEDWVAPDAESWPENAAMPDADIAAVAQGAGDYLRALLLDLAAHPGVRRRYAEVEASLKWPRGRLASVLGGFASKYRRTMGPFRPWHLHFDSDGVWWIWMDDRHASVTLAAVA